MKKVAFSFLLLLSMMVNAMAQTTARVEQVELKSEYFPFPRTLLIYTPTEYDEYTQEDYDVIFVFDAHERSYFDMVTSLMHYAVQEDNDQGYIVVGVASPYIEEFDYNRSNDFLPKREREPGDSPYIGNSPDFKNFIKNELKPYLAKNYRVTDRSLAIGHSLGGSFVIDALATDGLFDDCIAISPNLAFDRYRFAEALTSRDFSDDNKSHFIYLTMADEIAHPEDWSDDWVKGWNMVKEWADTVDMPKGVTLRTAQFPEYTHNKTPLPALVRTLKEYYQFHANAMTMDGTLHPMHIELTGSSLDGDIYITGNQQALANWNPKGIKMNEGKDGTRSIDLMVTLPAEFKFTKGSWEDQDQIYVTNGSHSNIRISSPSKATKYYTTF